MLTASIESTHIRTDYFDFGVTDSKGRAIGAKVIYMIEVMAESDDGYGFRDVPPGTYMVVRGRATRAGESFGAITGAVERFAVEDVAAHEAWVEKYLSGAKARAIKTAAK